MTRASRRLLQFVGRVVNAASMGSPARRSTRVMAYVMWTVAGLVSFYIPVISIRSTTSWLVYVWGFFLITGGLLCTYGSLTDKWIGELIGLPLLSSAFAVWFVVLGLAFTTSGTVGSLTFGGITAYLLARWRDVGIVSKEADRKAHPPPREVA